METPKSNSLTTLQKDIKGQIHLAMFFAETDPHVFQILGGGRSLSEIIECLNAELRVANKANSVGGEND